MEAITCIEDMHMIRVVQYFIFKMQYCIFKMILYFIFKVWNTFSKYCNCILFSKYTTRISFQMYLESKYFFNSNVLIKCCHCVILTWILAGEHFFKDYLNYWIFCASVISNFGVVIHLQTVYHLLLFFDYI